MAKTFSEAQDAVLFVWLYQENEKKINRYLEKITNLCVSPRKNQDFTDIFSCIVCMRTGSEGFCGLGFNAFFVEP